MCDRLAGDAQRLFQRLGLIDQNVGARRGMPLIVDQPLLPGGVSRILIKRRALTIGDRLGRIRHILVVASARIAGLVEPKTTVRQQIEIA